MHDILSLFYNRFAVLYDTLSFIISRGNWYRFQNYTTEEIRGKTVMDIGCGTGRLLSLIARSELLCVGIDISKAMIDISKKRLRKIKSNHVILIQGSAELLPIGDESIDTILVTNPTNFLLIEDFFHECFRIMAHDGVLIILDYPQFKIKTWFNGLFNHLLLAGNKRDLKMIIEKIENAGLQVDVKRVSDSKYESILIRSKKVIRYG